MANQILTQKSPLFNAPAHNSAKQSQPHNTTDILTTLDDLYQHQDFDAAALALGDAWLTLAPADQHQMVALIRELVDCNA
ncbi:MAG: hypothetical protein FOGNACKC_04210 [Anaerolineae bacterium]|nr:hypothetical protein [Anaerolineae bacterium]